MDYRRATAAAGVGAFGAVLASAGVWTLLYGLFRNFVPLPGAASQETALDLFLVFVAAPVLALAGGSLVAWKLGVRWWLSPLFSLGAHVAGILLWIPVYGLLANSLLESYSEFSLSPLPSFVLLYVFVVPLIVVPAAYYGSTPLDKRSILTLTIASIMLLLVTLLSTSGVVALVMGVLVWPLLTTLAVLLQTRRRSSGAG